MHQSVLRCLEVIRRGTLVATLFLVPLTFLPHFTFDPVNSPKLILLLIGTGIALGLRLSELALGSTSSLPRSLLWPVVALLGPLSIAWANGPHRIWSLVGEYQRFQGLLPNLVIVLFALLLADGFRDRPRVLAWTIVGTAAVAGLYSLVQTTHLDPFVFDDYEGWFGLLRASSTIGNPVTAGAFFAICLPLCLGLFVVDPTRRLLSGLLGFPIFIGLFASFSETALAAAVSGCAITGGLLLSRERRWPLRTAYLISASCAALIFIAVAFAMVSETASRFFGFTAQQRAYVWEAAFSMTADAPVLGRGPNVFALEGVQYRPVEEALTANYAVDDPHSIPLAYLTSAGFVGLLGFTTVVPWTMSRSRRASLTEALAAGFGGAAIAYFVQGVSGIDGVTLRVVFWACLSGIAVTFVGQSSTKRRPRGAGARLTVAVLAVITLLSAGVSGWRWARAERAMEIGYRAAQDNDAATASRAFADANKSAPLFYYRFIAGIKVGELGTRREDEGVRFIEEMNEYFDYLEGVPHVAGFVSQARLLHAWGTKVDPAAELLALSLINEAIRLDPYWPAHRVDAADILVALDRPDEAVSTLEALLEFQPETAPYWGALGLAYANNGEEAAARAAVARALALSPKDARGLQAQQLLND